MKSTMNVDLLNANLERLPADLGFGANPRNVISLANEARFTAANYSEPLTTYGLNWKDPNNIQATLDSVAPPVIVGRRFEYKSAANAEAFLSETDDTRAIGSSFKRVEFTGTSVNQKTINKGLTVRLDRDEDLSVPGAENRAVERLIQRLLRNDLRRIIAAISTAATNTAKTWDTTAGKDPDSDVMADLVTANTARGTGTDVIVYGETAWQKRWLSHRAQSTAGGFASSALTPEALAQILMVDRVVVSKEVYQSSASAKTGVVANLVLMYAAARSQTPDDPSNVKRFVTPTESGLFRVYREEHSKFVDVSVEHYSNGVVASTLGIRKFTVS